MYGLKTLDVSRLAYEIAVKTGVNNPLNETTKMAGKDSAIHTESSMEYG